MKNNNEVIVMLIGGEMVNINVNCEEVMSREEIKKKIKKDRENWERRNYGEMINKKEI